MCAEIDNVSIRNQRVSGCMRRRSSFAARVSGRSSVRPTSGQPLKGRRYRSRIPEAAARRLRRHVGKRLPRRGERSRQVSIRSHRKNAAYRRTSAIPASPTGSGRRLWSSRRPAKLALFPGISGPPHRFLTRPTHGPSRRVGEVSRHGTPHAPQVFVITLLLMMVLLVSAVLALPTWPYAEKWGYYPSGACGAIVTTMAALILAGRL